MEKNFVIGALALIAIGFAIKSIITFQNSTEFGVSSRTVRIKRLRALYEIGWGVLGAHIAVLIALLWKE